MEYRKHPDRLLKNFLCLPFLAAMVVPVVFADICLEIYQHVCFPLCSIPLVKRSQYIRIRDRAKLPYLWWYEKAWCAYCGYVNGWLHYASVIGGKTESYWCSVAHLENRGYVPSEFEKSFVKYGDEHTLRCRYAAHDIDYGKE